jgi:hypothetical protein
MVTRRYAKIFEAPCPIQIEQFAAGNSLDRLKPSDPAVVEEQFGFRTAE